MAVRYFLIPINKLKLNQVGRLGQVILFPYSWEEDGPLPCGEGVSPDLAEKIQRMLDRERPFLDGCGCDFQVAFALTEARPARENAEGLSCEAKRQLEIVDRELDVFRFAYCRFDSMETLMGRPGILVGNRLAIVADENLEHIQVIQNTPTYYDMSPGIGLEVPVCSDWSDNDFAQTLFLDRVDEVYETCRSILRRVGEAYHIESLDRKFEFLFTTFEWVGAEFSEAESFAQKKRYILSMIAKDQAEFDALSQQLYVFSKEIRTQVVHYGKPLTRLLSLKDADHMIDTLAQIIWRFCQSVIDTSLTDLVHVKEQVKRCGDHLFSYRCPVCEPLPDIKKVPDDTSHIFLVELSGYELTTLMKQGNVLFVPKNSFLQYNVYYSSYVYLDLRDSSGGQEIDLPRGLMHDVSPDLTERFRTEELDTLVYVLGGSEARAINSRSPMAIVLGYPWLADDTWSMSTYSAFADELCGMVEDSLSAVILSDPDIVIGESAKLPPRTGIRDQIRLCYRLDDMENKLQGIPGRIYEQYVMPEQPFDLDRASEQVSPVLYQCLFDQQKDEVTCLLRQALKSLARLYYLQEHSIIMRSLFEIIEMLCPLSIGKKNKSFILAFLASDKSSYFQQHSCFNFLWEHYRDPLVHSGRSVYELVENAEEVIALEHELEEMIVNACEEIYLSNAKTFDQVIEERKKRFNAMGIA